MSFSAGQVPTASQIPDGTWIDYSSSFTLTASTTNPTKGNSSYEARYTKMGRLVVCQFRILIGSTFSAGSGVYQFSLPVTALNNHAVGNGTIVDAGTAVRAGASLVQYGSSMTLVQMVLGTSQVTNSSPQAWASGDAINGTYIYEAE